jgi:quercetin dioxygenase-like cupin family protein
MNKSPLVIAASVVTLAASALAAVAQEAEHMALVASDAAVKWQAAPSNLPKGSQIAVLHGDPAQPGPFVLRVKFPPHTIVAPHTHATTENLTVLRGTLYHQMGAKLDQLQGKKLGHGGFVYLPGGMPHSVWTTETESIVEVTGSGPFGLKYVNPADDPSRTP